MTSGPTMEQHVWALVAAAINGDERGAHLLADLLCAEQARTAAYMLAWIAAAAYRQAVPVDDVRGALEATLLGLAAGRDPPP